MQVCERLARRVAAHVECGGISLIESLAEPWLDLCGEAVSDEPFYRPEWIGAYVSAFAPRGKLRLVTAHVGDRLAGLLPLIEEDALFCGFPVRMLRGAANAHSGRFDLIRASGAHGELAVRAIWDSVRTYKGWDVIELPYVPSGGSAEQLLSLARADGFLTGQCESDQTPYIPNLGESSRELCDGHFRRDLQRRLRKARARGPVFLKRVATADLTALQSFYALESGGWKGKNNTAIASASSTQRFYDEIASAGARYGYLSLYLLHVGDVVAAGHFGLAYKRRYYSAKVAYDENFSDCGPGHLIVQAILGDLAGREFEEYDFLGPWMEWKAKWASQVRSHAFCYVFRPGLYGTMLHATKLKLIKRLRSISRHPSIAYVRSRLHT